MSVRCPDCGAVAGYGGEIGHASDCPMVVGVSAATQMQIARLSGTLARRNVEITQLRKALEQFADPANWHAAPGLLQWMGKRSAIEFAESVLNDQSEAPASPDVAGYRKGLAEMSSHANALSDRLARRNKALTDIAAIVRRVREDGKHVAALDEIEAALQEGME